MYDSSCIRDEIVLFEIEGWKCILGMKKDTTLGTSTMHASGQSRVAPHGDTDKLLTADFHKSIIDFLPMISVGYANYMI